MSGEIQSFLTGTVLLDLVLVAALLLTLGRRASWTDRAARRAVAGLSAVAIGVQGIHFLEEWATGFHRRLPELLGLEPWSAELWVSFNLAWLAIWLGSLAGLAAGWRAALVAVWFLALASAVNGVAHPLLALAVGGYFPGLWSSPAAGAAGVLLLRRLAAFTRPAGA